MAKKKKVYVPVDTSQQSSGDKDDLLNSDPTEPVVTPYTTKFSDKEIYTDPTTGKSVLIADGSPIDPTMINEGETIQPDDVIIYKDMVQRTKEMFYRRFSRASTIVTGPMGLTTPVTVMSPGAFGTTAGASSDQILADARSQGFIPETEIEPTPDDIIESIIISSAVPS